MYQSWFTQSTSILITFFTYQGEEALLYMADGNTVQGTSFGAETVATGEVVFNTGMVG